MKTPDQDQGDRHDHEQAGRVAEAAGRRHHRRELLDSEKRMAFYHNGSRSPNNLFVYDFGSKKATKLTESLKPEIDPADLVESRVIRYKSFDGLEIPRFLPAAQRYARTRCRQS
jgi:dipeptidyl aminopeptidase/acylaminoacyl peptidase